MSSVSCWASLFNNVLEVEHVVVLLFQVMLDTIGPELQVINKSNHPISLEADTLLVLTPDVEKEATPNLLPINFNGLAKVSLLI